MDVSVTTSFLTTGWPTHFSIPLPNSFGVAPVKLALRDRSRLIQRECHGEPNWHADASELLPSSLKWICPCHQTTPQKCLALQMHKHIYIA